MFKSDKSFKILAYAVTLTFALAILYPLVYIVSNSLKDNNAIYELPPSLLPDPAESVTFVVDYNEDDFEDDAALEEALLRDTVRLFFGGLNALKEESVYEFVFYGTNDGEVIYSARAHKMLLELERDFGTYASTIFKEKTLMYGERYAKAMNKIDHDFVKSQPLPELDIYRASYDQRMKSYVDEKYQLSGSLTAVSDRDNNWLHLETFKYYQLLPSFAYHQNDRVVKFSFFAFMGNTVIVILWAMLTQTVLCSMSAFPISRMLSPKWSKVMLMFFLGTTMIPVVSILLPQFIMFREMGFYNNYAALLLPFLLPFGFFVYLYKGFFDRLPNSLFEAARIDGASHIYIYARIAMPLSKPIISLIALQTFLSNWNDYLWAWMVTERQELWTLNVALYNLSQNSAIKQNFVMGLSVLTILPVLLITIVFSSKVKQSIASTGIKG